MKNREPDAGFTLIETVICLGLISIISAAFLYVTLGAAATQRAGNAYDQRGAALISALETGEDAAGMNRKNTGTLRLNLGDGTAITLEEYILSSAEDEPGIRYYQYGP